MPGVELGIRCARVWILALTAAAEVVLAADGAPAREEASAALDRAVAFFRGKVAVQGGYVWRYSADLSKREGEGKVGPTTAVFFLSFGLFASSWILAGLPATGVIRSQGWFRLTSKDSFWLIR